MVIRFLQTIPSENPNFPFYAGQTIRVDTPSRFLLSLLDGVRAQVISVDPTERAIAPEISQPEPKPKRGRSARV